MSSSSTTKQPTEKVINYKKSKVHHIASFVSEKQVKLYNIIKNSKPEGFERPLAEYTPSYMKRVRDGDETTHVPLPPRGLFMPLMENGECYIEEKDPDEHRIAKAYLERAQSIIEHWKHISKLLSTEMATVAPVRNSSSYQKNNTTTSGLETKIGMEYIQSTKPPLTNSTAESFETDPFYVEWTKYEVEGNTKKNDESAWCTSISEEKVSIPANRTELLKDIVYMKHQFSFCDSDISLVLTATEEIVEATNRISNDEIRLKFLRALYLPNQLLWGEENDIISEEEKNNYINIIKAASKDPQRQYKIALQSDVIVALLLMRLSQQIDSVGCFCLVHDQFFTLERYQDRLRGGASAAAMAPSHPSNSIIRNQNMILSTSGPFVMLDSPNSNTSNRDVLAKCIESYSPFTLTFFDQDALRYIGQTVPTDNQCKNLCTDFTYSDEYWYELYYQEVMAPMVPMRIFEFITANDAISPMLDWLFRRHSSVISAISSSPPMPLIISNTLKYSEARRDKYLMQKILEETNHQSDNNNTPLPLLESARTIKVTKFEEAKEILSKSPWSKNEGDGSCFPVVFKPVQGAGSEFVTVCYSWQDLGNAFFVCSGQNTIQKRDASVVCIQEYLGGGRRKYSPVDGSLVSGGSSLPYELRSKEIIVDMVSFKGQHVVTDVWYSRKFPLRVKSSRLSKHHEVELKEKFQRNRKMCEEEMVSDYDDDDENAHFDNQGNRKKKLTTTFVYDYQDFVPPVGTHKSSNQIITDKDLKTAIQYAFRAADALEMFNGASHFEIMLTYPSPISLTDEGDPVPKLIEINPRMQGDIPRATELLGYDQISCLLHLLAFRKAISATDTAYPLWPPPGISPLYGFESSDFPLVGSRYKMNNWLSVHTTLIPPIVIPPFSAPPYTKKNGTIPPLEAINPSIYKDIKNKYLSDMKTSYGSPFLFTSYKSLPPLIKDNIKDVDLFDRRFIWDPTKLLRIQQTALYGISPDNVGFCQDAADAMTLASNGQSITDGDDNLPNGNRLSGLYSAFKRNPSAILSQDLLSGTLAKPYVHGRELLKKTPFEVAYGDYSSDIVKGDNGNVLKIVFLFVSDSGVMNENARRFIRDELPGFVRFTRGSAIIRGPGDGYLTTVNKTIDLFGCPCAVILYGPESVVEASTEIIRYMEDCNFPQTSVEGRLLPSQADLCKCSHSATILYDFALRLFIKLILRDAEESTDDDEYDLLEEQHCISGKDLVHFTNCFTQSRFYLMDNEKQESDSHDDTRRANLDRRLTTAQLHGLPRLETAKIKKEYERLEGTMDSVDEMLYSCDLSFIRILMRVHRNTDFMYRAPLIIIMSNILSLALTSRREVGRLHDFEHATIFFECNNVSILIRDFINSDLSIDNNVRGVICISVSLQVGGFNAFPETIETFGNIIARTSNFLFIDSNTDGYLQKHPSPSQSKFYTEAGIFLMVYEKLGILQRIEIDTKEYNSIDDIISEIPELSLAEYLVSTDESLESMEMHITSSIVKSRMEAINTAFEKTTSEAINILDTVTKIIRGICDTFTKKMCEIDKALLSYESKIDWGEENDDETKSLPISSKHANKSVKLHLERISALVKKDSASFLSNICAQRIATIESETKSYARLLTRLAQGVLVWERTGRHHCPINNESVPHGSDESVVKQEIFYLSEIDVLISDVAKARTTMEKSIEEFRSKFTPMVITEVTDRLYEYGKMAETIIVGNSTDEATGNSSNGSNTFPSLAFSFSRDINYLIGIPPPLYFRRSVFEGFFREALLVKVATVQNA